MTNPIDRLATEVRLRLAALLAVACLGLVWSTRAGTLTPGIVGPSSCDADGFCSPGVYTPGVLTPGTTIHGSDTSARVFLVAAALVLALVAARPRTRTTHRAARVATLALVAAAGLAAAERAVAPLGCLVLALMLAAPPAWARAGARAGMAAEPAFWPRDVARVQ